VDKKTACQGGVHFCGSVACWATPSLIHPFARRTTPPRLSRPQLLRLSCNATSTVGGLAANEPTVEFAQGGLTAAPKVRTTPDQSREAGIRRQPTVLTRSPSPYRVLNFQRSARQGTPTSHSNLAQ
jgi:hypothetical protein